MVPGELAGECLQTGLGMVYPPQRAPLDTVYRLREHPKGLRGILMPRGKNCRETIFAAHLPRNYPHYGGNFETGKNVLYCGGEAIWEAF